MKQYFKKTAVAVLLAAFLPMASGFCLMSILGISMFAAPAAAGVELVMDGNEACVADQGDASAPQPEAPLPSAGHGNSLMPCCVNNSHSGVPPISQATAHSFFPAIITVQVKLAPAASFAVAHRTPIASPPNLHAVLTTNLRL